LGAGLVCVERGTGSARQASKTFFFEKKNQKTSACRGMWRRGCHNLQDQKFFASFFQKRSAFFRHKNGGFLMPDSIIPILEAMKTSHQAHLERLLAWKAAGGKLPDYPNCETIDDFINRERLAVSRFALSIEHLQAHEPQLS
jgi:hypothetical protein